jgi:hypothetical protein
MTGRSRAAHIVPALRAHAPRRVETHYGIVKDLIYDHRTPVCTRRQHIIVVSPTCVAHGLEWYTH